MPMLKSVGTVLILTLYVSVLDLLLLLLTTFQKVRQSESSHEDIHRVPSHPKRDNSSNVL